MTQDKIISFLNRRNFKIIPLSSHLKIDFAWRIVKKVTDKRYTKTIFLENLKQKGFYATIENHGVPIAMFLARAVRIINEDGAYIELVWHNGTGKGRAALAYLGFCFLVALKPNTKIWYFAKKIIFNGSTPTPLSGVYEYDTQKVMGKVWAAAAA